MGTLQVRNVPDDVRTTLKARAVAAGKSLSEYVLGELSELARRPTIEELTARIAARGASSPETRAADVVRAEREER